MTAKPKRQTHFLIRHKLLILNDLQCFISQNDQWEYKILQFLYVFDKTCIISALHSLAYLRY